MEIKLVSYSPQPKKAIASAFLNMGIGQDFNSLDEVTEEQSVDALKEIFKSHLDAPLEFATFQFFWDDIPIFMREQLVRHRVGWSFASRSFRFFDINLKNPAVDYDWDAMPSINNDKKFAHPYFGDRPIKEVVQAEMERQLFLYSKLIEEGVDQQDARNVVGVWVPTALQTTCTYRALRNMLADRLSSQAHPFWQKAAKEIKYLITEIDPQLGAGLIDSCELHGRCVWRSKYDRDCASCIARGTQKAHEHKWTERTSWGENQQCTCGVMKQNLLNSASTSQSQDEK